MRPYTAREVWHLKRMLKHGFSARMAARVLGRSASSVGQVRNRHNLRERDLPRFHRRLKVQVTDATYDVLTAAAELHEVHAPGRIASIILECIADGAVDLLPVAVPSAAPPAIVAPMSSLFNTAPMSARL